MSQDDRTIGPFLSLGNPDRSVGDMWRRLPCPHILNSLLQRFGILPEAKFFGPLKKGSSPRVTARQVLLRRSVALVISIKPHLSAFCRGQSADPPITSRLLLPCTAYRKSAGDSFSTSLLQRELGRAFIKPSCVIFYAVIIFFEYLSSCLYIRIGAHYSGG
jgi:hypothetical protein